MQLSELYILTGENVTGDPISDPVEPPLGNQDADTMQEVMLDEVYRTTTDVS